MKKHFTFYSVGWMIVLFESLLCLVFALSVLLVNGTDALGKDHASLTLLIAITVASAVLMKSGKRFLAKAVVGMALLPLLVIGYEAMMIFLLPAHPGTGLPLGHPLIAGILLF